MNNQVSNNSDWIDQLIQNPTGRHPALLFKALHDPLIDDVLLKSPGFHPRLVEDLDVLLGNDTLFLKKTRLCVIRGLLFKGERASPQVLERLDRMISSPMLTLRSKSGKPQKIRNRVRFIIMDKDWTGIPYEKYPQHYCPVEPAEKKSPSPEFKDRIHPPDLSTSQFQLILDQCSSRDPVDLEVGRLELRILHHPDVKRVTLVGEPQEVKVIIELIDSRTVLRISETDEKAFEHYLWEAGREVFKTLQRDPEKAREIRIKSIVAVSCWGLGYLPSQLITILHLLLSDWLISGNCPTWFPITSEYNFASHELNGWKIPDTRLTELEILGACLAQV